ncbi:ATP-dependent DNA ligase [Marisediminicola antarctica]|uniref:DNA ligase (ATP) n=1 Tax=Marisediminicola antarctica TaxID=674079 RepID=A0A7L5AKD1_9MICO|nr:ATP-dependent DNA ligase [Marisediminicola antarctica]QHO70526.1 ATP-dependent DNA ligase [Marisediminicola antarctica]
MSRAEATPSAPTIVTVDGRRIRLTNLDKILYPETGTTKADVLDYYARVADVLIAHAANRPVTRKRWVHGVGTQEHPEPSFFQKNLDASTPDWVPRTAIAHRERVIEYPLVNDRATLTWLAQSAALELHVPQWRFGRTGLLRRPDRLVLDLDPGEGAGLAECAEVARLARLILTGMGLDPMPVTSGSKGIHLYAALDGSQDPEAVSRVARELARALESDHPDLIVSDMKKALRGGKVLVDWSQNNQNKTTITPYSLRGRRRPTVAAPRTWRELSSPRLAQLDYREVLDRLSRVGDPLARLSEGHLAALEPTSTRMAHFEMSAESKDRLEKYRSMRDRAKTPEPVPGPDTAATAEDGSSFVIQEHHARRLHFDFRLEHDGVLVSWALPKGLPADPRKNHLAVQTEDHPLEYGTFEGIIPAGEYGAGEVTIWDAGTYELEKWREGKEVIVIVHGEKRGTRKYALIHTGDNKWLIHLMDPHRSGPMAGGPGTDARASSASESGTPRPAVAPMLATLGTLADVKERDDDWAIEMKWDGIRAIATLGPDAVTFTSRNRNDLTGSYPDLAEIREAVDDSLLERGPAVLDGEIVVFNSRGRPDFSLLQTRMNLSGADARTAAARHPARFVVFDLLEANGGSLVRQPWSDRRALLEHGVTARGPLEVSPVFDGDADAAIAASSELGLEGIVAKKRDGTYAAGRRSRSWIKVKNSRTQEVVIGGWRAGRGRRAGTVGSLLLGVPGDGLLHYVGRVGSGFSDRALDNLAARFHGLERQESPFDDVPRADESDAHWLAPTLVGEVEFAEWTSTGRLRHPAWRGWRPDKNAADVVRETT